MKTKGLIAAPVTPFKPNGDIHPELIYQYANFLKFQGVKGVFVNGTTGEGYSLSDDERKTMVEAWCSEKENDFKVMVHIGHTCQRSSIMLAQHAAEHGADAVGEMGPIFFKPETMDELVQYCKVSSECTDLPYYYYHMPSMNGLDFNMSDFLIRAVEELPKLTGIKYTHHNLDDFSQSLNFNASKYDVLFGRDEKLHDALKRGAYGAVGSTYNFLAPLYYDIIKSHHSDDGVQAEQLQTVAIEIIQTFAKCGFFSALRHALRVHSLETGEPRAPLKKISPQDQKEVESQLQILSYS